MLWGKRFAAALAALFFSTAVFAQDSAATERHLYIGGGGGQAQWRPGCSASVPNCDDTSNSLHAFAGYQWNSHLAAEVVFTNYGRAIGTNYEVKGHGWEASAVGSWPLFASVSVLGRLGGYRGLLKGGGQIAGTTETNYAFTYGVGAQIELTHNLAARMEWQTYPGAGGSTIPDNDIKIISVSALWRFR